MRRCARSGRRALVLASCVLTVAWLAAGSWAPGWADPPASGRAGRPGPTAPDRDASRGLVYTGLFPALPGSPCEGAAFEIHEAGGGVSCTHGPDPAPAGIDVRAPRPLATLQAEARALGPAAVPCIGNGTSGRRVQAIYAVSSDQADRYEAIAPLIRVWASYTVADIVAASAWETGGSRAVRFVTDPSCQLIVDHVVLSPAADDDFGTTISELRAKGYVASDRKYMVWMDAAVVCGIAQFYGDDHDGPSNLSNGSPLVQGEVERTDSGCWGLGGTNTPVEAHELLHTLGSVQNSAPHSTSRFPQSPGAHCTDDRDTMCYADGPGVVIDIVCTDPFHERRLDCGHDDYFSTAPAPGSYLDTHWNSADNSFLAKVQPPVVTGLTPAGAQVGKLVTIAGVGFAGATSVAFGGVVQPSFTVVDDHTITAKVPSGALTAQVSVTGALGTAYSLVTFKVKPKVTGFTPGSGSPGTSVTISGTAFTGAVVVKFGTAVAPFTVLSYTSISATVPAGAATGPITVITPGGTGTSAAIFVVT